MNLRLLKKQPIMRCLRASGPTVVAGVVLLASAVRADEPAKPARAQPGGAWRAVEEWAPRAYDAAEKFSRHREWRVRDFTAVGGSLPGQPDSIDRLSERANRLREKSQEFVNKPLAKHGNLVIKYSGAAGTILGQASAGDFRGAATSMVDLGAKEASAKIGAAAGGVFFSAAGWLIGGPPGAMVGGVVGGAVGETIAESELYQAYLAPQVKRFSQWFDPEVDGFKLALAMRQAQEAQLQLSESMAAELNVRRRSGYESPADAERQLRSAPESVALTSDAGAPAGLLPRTCVVRHWNPEGKFPVVLYINDGQVSARTGDSLPQGGKSGRFRGRLDASGCVVRGGWTMSDGSHSTETWTFHPDHQVHISITWYYGEGKPYSGTVIGPWRILGQE